MRSTETVTCRMRLTVLTALGIVASSALLPGTGRAALPDGRGYELVSPADKNGGDVATLSSRTRAAVDGSAVGFTSLAGFGDVHGTSIGSEYLSERTGVSGTQGWVTHGITPPQPPLPFQAAWQSRDPNYEGELSADLNAGVYRAIRPLTGDTSAANIENLYLRTDLRTPGPGSYQLLTPASSPIPATLATMVLDKPAFAGASSDFTHVVFESRVDLTPDAPPQPDSCLQLGFGCQIHLYEWANGVLRLVDFLPDGTVADSAQAGQSVSIGRYAPHTISSDGSRIVFAATAGGVQNVYMRVDGTTTIQLNASEKTTPESPQGASLWGASADGSRVFFITSEGLVDGDDDGGPDLYMYDANAPAGHRLTRISGAPAVGALSVVGTSDDGAYVYFVDDARSLYLWHGGALSLIGEFANPDDVDRNGPRALFLFDFSSEASRVSPDGRHLLFMTRSDAGFTGHGGFGGYDHGSACTLDTASGGPCRELYLYDADSGTLRCASCNPSGAPATADALTAIFAANSNTSSTSHLSHLLSDDGRWVFFTTREALVPEDVNGRLDAYEYDTTTGQPHLISSGTSPDDSYFLDASASGRDVFFATRDRLVGWDVDGSYDLYDARVGGGLPDPPPPSPGCVGEACKGPAATPPTVPAPGSSAFVGRGDAPGRLRPHRTARPVRCRRGTRRKLVHGKVRCVRRAAVRRAARHGRGGAR